MHQDPNSICNRAHQLGLDLERHMRQERLNGHLSPTDSAVLQRVSTFLLKTLPEEMKGKGNPEDRSQRGG